jgi:propionate CoA-transferase
VEQLTYLAALAAECGQPVLYVTERCVFRLAARGMELIEIAPGADLRGDVLSQMEFAPAISPQLRAMDARILAEGPMGLRDSLLGSR